MPPKKRIKKQENGGEAKVELKRGNKFPCKEDCVAALNIPSNQISKELLATKYKTEEGKTLSFFPTVPQPTHIDDWLAQYVVPPQNFSKWKSLYKPITETRDTIYLLPVLHNTSLPPTDILAEFIQAYYPPLKVKILTPLRIVNKDNTHILLDESDNDVSGPMLTRVCQDYYTEIYKPSHVQIALDSFEHALMTQKDKNSYCVLGVTMVDLFQDNKDEFIVGSASMSAGIGIFSFARYDPLFSEKSKNKTENDFPLLSEVQQKHILLTRALKVTVHEIGHMMGLDHCIYYHCLMNGSGHISEDDKQPFHLCPVDLRKIHFCLSSDKRSLDYSLLRSRYQNLLLFFERYDMKQEVLWTTYMLKSLNEQK